MQTTKPSRDLRAAMKRCSFRTLIGRPGTRAELLDRVGFVFAAIGGEPVPMADDLLQDAMTCIQSGETVLILADRPDLRDLAKRQVQQMVALLDMPAAVA